jgi:hypothetical protein
MAADHGAEEQQDQSPPNELKLKHWYFPNATMSFLSACVGISGRSTTRKYTST